MDIPRLKRFFSRSPRELDPLEAYELWAETYDDRDGNALLFAEERVLASLLDRSLIEGRDVLDAGCGTGRHLKRLQECHPRSVSATDLSPKMLERAREKISHATFHVGPIEHLPFQDASFDVILCTLVLGHVPHLPTAIAEMSRVLRPGGSIVISDFHPFGKLLGWQRTFTAGQKRLAVKYSMHLHGDFFDAFHAAGLEVAAMVEPKIDASLEQFYVAANRLDIYHRYFNYPILILFRVVKR
jgi:malonyl-CoA O-methyltransferase